MVCVFGTQDTFSQVELLSDDIQPSSTATFSPFHLTWQAAHTAPLLSRIKKIIHYYYSWMHKNVAAFLAALSTEGTDLTVFILYQI